MDISLNPSRRDVRVFAAGCFVFFPLLGWILPRAQGSLPVMAGITGACWLAAARFDREHTAGEKAMGLLIPGLILALWGAFRAAGLAGLDPVTIRVGAAVALGAVGALVGGWAILSPVRGASIYRGWMLAALPIGWTVAHVLLGVVYFGVLTPIGLVMRLAGRDPLHRKFDPDAKTYWSEHKQPTDRTGYFRQF